MHIVLNLPTQEPGMSFPLFEFLFMALNKVIEFPFFSVLYSLLISLVINKPFSLCLLLFLTVS